MLRRILRDHYSSTCPLHGHDGVQPQSSPQGEVRCVRPDERQTLLPWLACPAGAHAWTCGVIPQASDNLTGKDTPYEGLNLTNQENRKLGSLTGNWGRKALPHFDNYQRKWNHHAQISLCWNELTSVRIMNFNHEVLTQEARQKARGATYIYFQCRANGFWCVPLKV